MMLNQRSIAYVMFIFLGVGNLFPWNVFINAGGYFASRFCGTLFSDNFENYFSFSFTVSQTIGLALSVKYQNTLSLWTRIAIPLMTTSTIFLINSIFVVVDMNSNLLFVLTLICTFICGSVGSLLSGGLFGLAAVMPSSFTGALMTGQGVAGAIVSLSDIFTLLAAADTSVCSDDDTSGDDSATCDGFVLSGSTLAYFLIATFILIFCVAIFIYLRNMSITK